MREIKFRLWLPKINKMLYNEDVDTDKFKELQKLSDYDYPFEGDEFYPWHSVYNWIGLEADNKHMIPLQYTGLKDKNGVEIYEGDILEYTFDGATKRDVIVYEGNMFTYRNAIRWNLQSDKVIGNIYENPELLEEVK